MGEQLTTQAIVLRYTDFNENDRMLTLFSLEQGKLSSAIRGVRKNGAKLRTASEIFTYGEYILAKSKDRYSVTQFNAIDSFHPLRYDFDRLTAGILMLNICEETLLEGTPEPELFVLLLRCLKELCHTESMIFAVVSVFLLKFCVISGYTPVVEYCVHCSSGKELSHFDALKGGVCCEECGDEDDLPHISAISLEIMKQIIRLPMDSLFSVKLTQKQSSEIYGILNKYISIHLEKHLKIIDYIGKYGMG